MRPSIPTSDLLDAAAALVAERGLAGVRMDAVASRAGVAKGVPYGRFASKAELLSAMIDREIVLAIRTSIELVQSDPHGGTFSRMWVHGVEALHARPALVRLYSSDAAPLADLASERADRLRARALIGSEFLRELQSIGVIDATLDPDALAANLALWNHALATTAPHDNLAALLTGMGDLLARSVDAARADPRAGVAAFVRFATDMIDERETR